MQRYFSNLKFDNYYVLSNEDSYHIKKVMRMNVNDQIEVVDNNKTFLCEIVSLSPVKARIIKDLNENHENIKKIIVVQSLVNENKMDFILQKCTELGAYSFYGYKAHNSIIKENNKGEKKLLRWQKIVKEASEQAKRNMIPEVMDIIDLNTLSEMKADVKLLLSVRENEKNMKNILQTCRDYDTIMIVVGPEGGFTTLEEEKLIKKGFIRTSLGKRVLRCETASVAAMAMINYEWMV